eukprot:TRINITY_DN9352_c0_g1_i4.p1 TRINITY_DN9352_c0_g1~~TRINITY_DN9352_c0_g1_i4.p1  ORF type:complete len:157 (-),score=47.08 TRINITY_DN9352_c0_g1_i4:96-566(-)
MGDGIKELIGEVFYEVAQGFQNGMSDFEPILKENFTNAVNNSLGDSDIVPLTNAFFTSNLWNDVIGVYHAYAQRKAEEEERNRRQQPPVNNMDIEEEHKQEAPATAAQPIEEEPNPKVTDLLNRINETSALDEEKMENAKAIPLSEAYHKGSVGKN